MMQITKMRSKTRKRSTNFSYSIIPASSKTWNYCSIKFAALKIKVHHVGSDSQNQYSCFMQTSTAVRLRFVAPRSVYAFVNRPTSKRRPSL